MKIYVQCDEGCFPLKMEKGDLIDLYNKETITLKKGQTAKLNLGVRMQIPKGFKANLLPRSSTFDKYYLTLLNSVGQIDSSYCGPNDVWRANVEAKKDTIVPAGVRVFQFEIVPSMFATFLQKLRWLFTSRIELVEVKKLNNENRGGFGASGK